MKAVALLLIAVAVGAVAMILSRDAAKPDAARCCDVTIQVEVPADTGLVYLAGNAPSLGPWSADGLAMDGRGSLREATVNVPAGQTLAYKFTLGNWQREAHDKQGGKLPNFELLSMPGATVRHQLAGFLSDPREYLSDSSRANIPGTLQYWPDFRSRFLADDRHISIWLPPGYDERPDQRYNVLYMHDGQNLFDARLASYSQHWGVAETVTALMAAGTIEPLIVVGVWNSPQRTYEYSPWHGAPKYARFLIDELMPRINANFRTLEGPAHTAVMGSSMGGLLSFYLVREYPDVFGACGCMSTHFPLSESVYVGGGDPDADTVPYLQRDIEAGVTMPGGVRLWFDYGTRGLDAGYRPSHMLLEAWLEKQGFDEGIDFVIRRYPGADHNEVSWRRRLADPLTFIFPAATPATTP